MRIRIKHTFNAPFHLLASDQAAFNQIVRAGGERSFACGDEHDFSADQIARHGLREGQDFVYLKERPHGSRPIERPDDQHQSDWESEGGALGAEAGDGADGRDADRAAQAQAAVAQPDASDRHAADSQPLEIKAAPITPEQVAEAEKFLAQEFREQQEHVQRSTHRAATRKGKKR